MKSFTFALAVITLIASPALAQHAHGSKGPNGGPMEDVAGVHAELIVAGNNVTINVLDEKTKPVATKGYSGSVLIVSGANRETVALEPFGAAALKGAAKSPVPTGSSISLVLKTDSGKSGQVRFKP